MTQIPGKFVDYSGHKKISDVYDSIRNDHSGNTSIYLIRSFSQVRRIEGFLLSVDSLARVMNARYVTKDSLIKTNHAGQKWLGADQLKAGTKAFYLIDNVSGLYHMQSLLVVFNGAREIQIELDNPDGDILECASFGNSESYLSNAITLLRTFKGLYKSNIITPKGKKKPVKKIRKFQDI